VIKVLKFLGMLDASGKPQASYREYMDHTKSKRTLAERMLVAYDDLFKSDKNAHAKTATDLKGWFKTKTGAGEKAAEKMATTFKSLASYANFDGAKPVAEKPQEQEVRPQAEVQIPPTPSFPGAHSIGLTYRIEVHLPDTTNVDAFRAIFRAIREELMS
jgi:hypothetical protein